MWLESMTIFHFAFISATYSTLWSWACLQIYWYNIIQSLSYTQLQMFANSRNLWRFAMFQQRFGTKLIFQSWRIEWFPCDFEVIHSQVGQKFWHNGGHSKWISCLLWSRSFRSCGLWASDPRVTTDFWWEEFSESFGEVCFETCGIFLLGMFVIFMREVLQWTSMDTTNSSNMQTEAWKMFPNGLRWNSTMDLLACLTVKISASDLDDEDENPWSLLHVLKFWGTPRFHHECAEHWNLWVLFWCLEMTSSHMISWCLQSMLLKFNASQIQRQFLTAWHRYLSTSIWRSKSTPRFPVFFVGQTLVFLSLARSEASFWEDHWCLKRSFHTIQIDCEQSYDFLQILSRLQRRVSK